MHYAICSPAEPTNEDAIFAFIDLTDQQVGNAVKMFQDLVTVCACVQEFTIGVQPDLLLYDDTLIEEVRLYDSLCGYGWHPLPATLQLPMDKRPERIYGRSTDTVETSLSFREEGLRLSVFTHGLLYESAVLPWESFQLLVKPEVPSGG